MRTVVSLFGLCLAILAIAHPSGAETVRVACIGDSITFGTGIDSPEQNAYPAQLQAMLGAGFEVRNFGVPSAGVCESGIRGKDWQRFYLLRPEFQQSLEFRPHVVVINLGINDIMQWDRLAHEFAPSYARIIAAYRDLPTRPRILIASPLGPLLLGHPHHNDPNLEKLNTAVAAVAEDHDLETFDFAAPFNQPFGMFADLIHPNARGAHAIARTVVNALLGSPGESGRFTLQTSFESHPAGPVGTVSDRSGQWTASPGAAEVSNLYRQEGFHSLRVLGGEERVVEWTAAEPVPAGAVLSFWAARWTARPPFELRLQAQHADGSWHDLDLSDTDVITLSEHTRDFQSFVAVTLPEQTLAIRLTCTSPDRAGILLDAWRVTGPWPDAIRARAHRR